MLVSGLGGSAGECCEGGVLESGVRGTGEWSEGGVLKSGVSEGCWRVE